MIIVAWLPVAIHYTLLFSSYFDIEYNKQVLRLQRKHISFFFFCLFLVVVFMKCMVCKLFTSAGFPFSFFNFILSSCF